MAQNEFRNALQAMSNSAASTVSAPVDGIAWLLRKAGVPIPGNALMGSDWMAAQGLTAPVRPGASQIAGDTLGLFAPMVAAAKAPQIARGLLSLDDKAMDMGRRAVENQLVRTGGIQPATVWHGSPHKFDAFDSSKIGTGEGAQAYGHGLYLAEAPDVAAGYQKALGAKVLPWMREPDADYYAAHALSVLGDKERAATFIAAQVDAYPSEPARNAAISMLRAGKDPAAQGNLYKVDLPDEKIARMLDWDKPLSQQAPEVQAALPDFASRGVPSSSGLRKMTGEEIVQELGRHHADKLRRAGIPGIRYLDGGSRSAGAGSSNFVVFPGEENALRILERNGQGLLGK